MSDSDTSTPTPPFPPPPTPQPSWRLRYERWVARLRVSARENMVQLCLGGLIFSFLVVYLSSSIFILIGPGEAGVLFRRLSSGTDTETIYGEGLHIIAPWNKMFLYDLRVQERTQLIEALSQNGLTISVNVSMRYFPEKKDLARLHQKVGPDYANRIVQPEVVTGVREVIGKYLPQQLYTENTRLISDAIIEAATRSVSEKFIRLDDVNILNIRLPKLVTSAIESKLTQEQMAEEYRFRQDRAEKEAVRMLTEAQGTAKSNNEISASLTPDMLRFKGIEATLELAKSTNAKVVIVGSGRDGMPIITIADGPPAAVPRP
jgi:regulator of protease activity HflC (stomatin/prohibitin superfamily)